MKFGLVFPPFFPTAGAEMTIDAAHALHADSLWSFDHLLGVFHPALYGEMEFAQLVPDPDGLFDPFCLCAWAARSTDLPLGIAVTDGIRRGAADVARSALTLQHLCKGGFNLGVGAGEAENLVPFGYSFERPVATTEAFLADLRQLLDQGTMPRHGGRLGLPLRSEAGQPRVWIAAHRPRMLRLVGRYGDGWLPVDAPTADEYAQLKTAVLDQARRAGRPDPEASLFIFLVLGESRARLREMFDASPLAKLFALWMAPAAAWTKYGLPNPAGESGRAYIDIIPHRLDPAALREFAPRIPFELIEEYVFMGNAVEVAERLGRYANAGLEHPVILNLTGLVGGMDEAMARGPELGTLRGLLAADSDRVGVPG
ncbi:MAG TPA: LLM class flavin-dependent oxidoreductase [Actinomycetospora sp.]|jgi:phthiodiolone/phenolphthiodiolone dimycocerosates ketoreductase|uniref:LLM class flavin-dependent oxidoreductase n=1 Tax=Actinomycetospora sp. TaxID=1872135 RepID=UPI002F400AEA